ncbi:MAG: DUF494 domain-containing protein, partial [Proteobacteria bacterium]|nr:DUF494 domain-containing protein [Pseudomonadota bacterium]
MKENLLDVLMYLFENYLDDETEIQPDRDLLRIELEEAGFDRGEVNKAFSWLEGLAADPATGLQHHATSSIRVFNSEELLRIEAERADFTAIRDVAVYRLAAKGASYSTIGRVVGLTKERGAQLVRRANAVHGSAVQHVAKLKR